MRTLDERLPAPTRVAEAPQLWVADDFLDGDDIDAALAFFGDEGSVAAHAHHYGWDGSGFVAEVPARATPALARIADRVTRATGVTSAGEGTFRFRHYGEGEAHPPHCDAYDSGDGRLAVTALVHLLDGVEGGETAFPAASPEPVAVSPRRGRLVAWTSLLPDGREDPASVHAGMPVRAGSKAVLMYFAYVPHGAYDVRLALGG